MTRRRTYQDKELLLRNYVRLNRITKTEFKQLMRLSKDKSSVIRFEVATILFDVKNQASKKLLFQLAKDRDSLVRAEAYTSLSGFKFADVEEFLRKAIEREKDELACSYAITSWGEVALKLFDEHDEDINYVNKLLRTHKIMVSERCRLECYYALYGFGDKRMLKKIMKFLKSTNPYIRYIVYDTLELSVDQDNRSEIIDVLEKMLVKEELPEYRKKIISFLKKQIVEVSVKDNN